jgi:hypothetical protein
MDTFHLNFKPMRLFAGIVEHIEVTEKTDDDGLLRVTDSRDGKQTGGKSGSQ